MAESASVISLFQGNSPTLAPEHKGPAAYPTTDTADPALYHEYARALLDEQRQALEPLWRVWTQNLLFLAGQQWWTYDKRSGVFRLPNVPPWKERPVRNLCLPHFRHVLAKLTKNRPVGTSQPASADQDDLDAAELGDEILRAKWDAWGMTGVQRRWLAWMIGTGNGWAMPYWNGDGGPLVPLTATVYAGVHDEVGPVLDGDTGEHATEAISVPCGPDGEPILDEQGNYDLEAEPAYVYMGEVADRVLSPFQVFVDPAAETEDQARWIIVAEPIPLREIRERYTGKGLDNLGTENTSDFDRYTDTFQGAMGGADTHATAALTSPSRQIGKAIVIHYFERPCVQFPQGRHWVTANGLLLEEPGPLPDQLWPPVVHLGDVPVPGRLLCDATLTHVVGLNREYNEVNAQIKEHHNLLLRGKWLVPIGSGIRRGQITAEPGEVIQHTPGLPPKPADLPRLPREIYEERGALLNDIESVGGIRKVSTGAAPPGVTAGRAFLVLQEADDTDLAPMIEAFERATAKLSWLHLQLVQQHYQDERILMLAGENGGFRARAFKGADLAGVADVLPQSGSAFPWSSAARQSFVVELAQQFPMLFSDPETGQFDTDKFRRLLPLGGGSAVSNTADLDLDEARREEDLIQHWDGVAPLPMPQPWQDTVRHLGSHARVLKSAGFQNWPPVSQQAMIQHWLETAKQHAEAMQAEAAFAAGAAGGGPGGPGDAPGGPEGSDNAQGPAGQANADQAREEAGLG